MSKIVTVVAVSDTHGVPLDSVPLPKGDIFVYAGDMCGKSQYWEVSEFARMVKALPYEHKVVIAGNHDIPVSDYQEMRDELASVSHYLQDSGVTIIGLRFYGSPYSPDFFPDNWVFNQTRKSTGTVARWNAIPDDVNVLITHGPPQGVLDKCPALRDRSQYVSVGCEVLRKRVAELSALKLHVFGHIHEGRGTVKEGNVLFANVAALDGRYRPYNEMYTVVELEV